MIIDETYNANPASMRAALGVLGAMPRAQVSRAASRCLAICWSLATLARNFTPDLKARLTPNGIDLVFCAGPLMAHLYAALPEHKRGGQAGSSQEFLPAVLEAVRGGDAVMVKGSLGSRMGPLAEALRMNLAKPAGRQRSRNESLGVGLSNACIY